MATLEGGGLCISLIGIGQIKYSHVYEHSEQKTFYFYSIILKIKLLMNQNMCNFLVRLPECDFQVNRKMVNTIWFRFDLIRFRKDLSVCTKPCVPRQQGATFSVIYGFIFLIFMASTIWLHFQLFMGSVRAGNIFIGCPKGCLAE